MGRTGGGRGPKGGVGIGIGPSWAGRVGEAKPDPASLGLSLEVDGVATTTQAEEGAWGRSCREGLGMRRH